MKRCYLAVIVIGAVILQLTSSCKSDVARKSGTLLVAIPGKIDLLNPELSQSDADRFVNQFIYGTLVEKSEGTFPLALSLSNSWLINVDSSRFILYLNKDLFYNQSELFGEAKSRPAVALDVVASIKNYIVARKASRLTIEPFEHLLGVETFYDNATPQNFLSTPLDGVIFSDDHTLVFEFYEPERKFFQHMSDITLAIRPFEYFTQNRHEIVGFGYYKVVAADDQKIVLEKSPRAKERGDLTYDRIEVWQNLTYERINQFLTEGTIDVALDLTDEFIKKFLEANIHRLQNIPPDFKIVPVGERYRIFSTAIDTTLMMVN